MSYGHKRHIRNSTLKKAVEKALGATDPMIVYKNDQVTFMEKLRVGISKIPHISVHAKPHWNSGGSRYESVGFDVNLGSSFLSNVEFSFEFDSDGRLYIKKKYHSDIFAHIGKAEDLVALASCLRDIVAFEEKHVEKLQGEAIKREKIKSLKRVAISAKITELCDNAQVKYIISDLNHKIRLYVLLKNEYFMEIDISYNDFHPVLQNLPTAIRALQALQDKGINVRVKPPNQMDYDANWTKPKKMNKL